MLPLLSLMDPKVHPKLTAEACPNGQHSTAVKRRPTLLYFRGAHGTGDSTRSGLATERVVAIPESPVRAARDERRATATSPRPPADGGGGEDPPSPSVFYV